MTSGRSRGCHLAALVVAGALVGALLGPSHAWASTARPGGISSSTSATGSATGVSVVGDSLTEGTLPYQPAAFTAAGWTTWVVDGYTSRGIATKVAQDPHNGLSAVDAIRSRSGDTNTWVVALGTNDSGIYAPSQYLGLIQRMLDRIGPDHVVYWVDIYLPAMPARQQAWNDALAVAAAEWSGHMIVVEWSSIASGHPEWLQSDQIHDVAAGYRARAAVITDATATLAAAAPTAKSAPDVESIMRGAEIGALLAGAVRTRVDTTTSQWR
jgi:lysophospholipase L1-like esterase